MDLPTRIFMGAVVLVVVFSFTWTFEKLDANEEPNTDITTTFIRDTMTFESFEVVGPFIKLKNGPAEIYLNFNQIRIMENQAGGCYITYPVAKNILNHALIKDITCQQILDSASS